MRLEDQLCFFRNPYKINNKTVSEARGPVFKGLCKEFLIKQLK